MFGIISAPVLKLSEAVKLFLANFFGLLKLFLPILMLSKELNDNLVLSRNLGLVNFTVRTITNEAF